MSSTSLWLTMLGMGTITYAIRLSFILLWGRITLPPALQRSLRFVPPAVFSAIIFPEICVTAARGTYRRSTRGCWRGSRGAGRLAHAQHDVDDRRRDGGAVGVTGGDSALNEVHCRDTTVAEVQLLRLAILLHWGTKRDIMSISWGILG